LRVLAWAKAMGVWYRGRSHRIAFIAALLTVAGVSTLWETYSFLTSRNAINVLMWNPAPGWIRDGLVFGVQLGWLAGFLTLSVLLRYYRRVAMRLSDSSRWGPEDPMLEQVISDFEKVFDNRGAGRELPLTEGALDPYGVLGIELNASIQEIKNAYRDAIKRCHPDTVADRSEYIKTAAEFEARKINNAYEAIRAERNFS
jgi:DnaJ domain